MKWMLTCEQVALKTSDFVDNGGSWTERLLIRAHVTMCGACREYVRQMTLVVGALRGLPRRAPDGAARERLRRLFPVG